MDAGLVLIIAGVIAVLALALLFNISKSLKLSNELSLSTFKILSLMAAKDGLGTEAKEIENKLRSNIK